MSLSQQSDAFLNGSPNGFIAIASSQRTEDGQMADFFKGPPTGQTWLVPTIPNHL